MSSLPVRAIAYGALMGTYTIAFVYLVVTFLPMSFGFLIPLGGLLVPMLFQWPRWFDRGVAARWPRRLVRRLGFLAAAAPAAALTSFLIVAAVPGYLRWTDAMHRQSLERRGMAEAEIVAQLDAHRQTIVHVMFDGALLATIPGAIAALVTTAAGGIVWRRRSSRTSSPWVRDSDTPRSAS